MSERLTRRHLDEALDEDRTDWPRVRALTDADIDAAIADDPDTWAIDDQALADALAQRPRFETYEAQGRWSWRLRAGDGQVLAEAGRDFASLDAAREAIARIPAQILGAHRDAA